MEELEDTTSLTAETPSPELAKVFDPVARSRARRKQLPSSRYKYRSPKYYRGPLHPHQPPPPSDPASREYIPGPFSLSRIEQTYDSTIASDIMTLAYQHYLPGERPTQKPQRLRKWEGDSPYFKNRPLRGPRGGPTLDLLRKPINFRNIPKLEGVTVHSMAREAVNNSAYLHVAGMVIQAITNVRCTVHISKMNIQQWDLRKGKYVAVTARLQGEDMYDFLGKTIDLVLPKIKEWKGVKGTSGDSNGNISFGITPEAVASYPEIEVNYDMYPPKMIPGCHITLHTTATNDRDARLLMRAFGLPFYGKHID